MTATGVLNALTATIDALRQGRLAVTPPPPVAAHRSAPLIQMACPRCSHPVQATIPPDEDGQQQNLAFKCTHCGVAASWI